MSFFLLLALWTCICSFSCGKNDVSPRDLKAGELVLQPGPSEGQDCLVAFRDTDNDYYAGENHRLNPDITAIRWTYYQVNAGYGTNRTYLKFTGLDSLPPDADVVYARLSLYGMQAGVAAPLGNSYYPGSPYEMYGENSTWLKRVLSDWSDSTITWNNKPETTDEYQAGLPATNLQWSFNVTDVDVTNMVREMVGKKENFGFCLQLRNETIYKSVLFGSSEAEDKMKRPKLVVQYVKRG